MFKHIVEGKKPAKTSKEEIIVFDFEGLTIQDATTLAFFNKKALIKKMDLHKHSASSK